MNSTKKLLLLGLLLLTFTVVKAQVQFQTTIDLGASEQASDIKPTADGGYIVAGLQYATGNQSAFLLKLDALGAVQWNKTYSGGYTSGSNLFTSYRVIQLTEGGYLMVGSTQGFGFSTPQIYVIKTDVAGDTVWTRTYGGASGNNGNSVFEAEDGTYVIGGSFSLNGQRRMGVLRLKSDGSLRSESYFADGLACPFFECVPLSPNRYGIIYAYSSMLTILDSVGNFIDDIPLGFGSGFSVGALEEANGEFVTLNQISGLVGSAFGLVRTSISGTTSLAKKFASSNDDTPRELIRASNGNYILFGLSTSMNGPSFLQAMEIDTSGNIVWSNRYSSAAGAYHEAANIVATQDGGFVMVGQYDRSGQYSDFDVYIVKTDGAGQSGCNQTAFTPTISSASPISPSAVTTFPASITNTGTAVPAVVSSISTVNPIMLCLTAGVNEIMTDATISVFPNPASELLYLDWKEASFITSQLYDISGRLLQTVSGNELNVQSIPDGMYVIRVSNDKGETVLRRISIAH
jgi:hypothetical protein